MQGQSEAGGALLVFLGIMLIAVAVSLIGWNIEKVQIFNLLCILQVMVGFVGNMKSRCRKGSFRNMGILYPSLFFQDRVMSPVQKSLGFLFVQKHSENHVLGKGDNFLLDNEELKKGYKSKVSICFLDIEGGKRHNRQDSGDSCPTFIVDRYFSNEIKDSFASADSKLAYVSTFS